MNKIIALWSHPRAVSTAFLRMIMQRGDFHVIHEPFSYLQMQKAFLVEGTRIETHSQLVDHILKRAEAQSIFFKDTTDYHHGALLEDSGFLGRLVNTFIIRDPHKAISSHYAINPRVTLAEIGYEHQFEIFSRVREITGRTPVVIDADDLIRDPVGMAMAYCERVQIPFIAEALSWESGARKEWAPTSAWHLDVSNSTRIEKVEKHYEVTVDNHEELARYYRHHLPFYQQMHAPRLTT